jgi:hypothetical protein
VAFDPSYEVFCASIFWKSPSVSNTLTGFKVSWGEIINSLPVIFKTAAIPVDGMRQGIINASFNQSTDKLEPGREYFVEVSAVHFGGVDEPAPREKFETPGLYPAPPGNVKVEVLESGVLVSWSEPEEESIYPPISYTVLWGTQLVEDDTDGLQEISLESVHLGNISVLNDTLMCMLTLLEGATHYYLQVWAVSAEGPGLRSEPIDFYSELIFTACPSEIAIIFSHGR